MKRRYVILYGTVLDDDDAGIFLDAYFLGGIVESRGDADKLAWDLTNDRAIPGTVLTKTYGYNSQQEYTRILGFASKQFTQMANDMYEAEEIQKKMRNRL